MFINSTFRGGLLVPEVQLPLRVMGADIDGTSNPLNAVLDDVMIFNRALTATEVRQAQNATRGP